MEYIIVGLSFLFGGIILFVVAGVVAYFAEWSFTELFIGGDVGFVVRLILHILFKKSENSYVPTYTGSSYMSNRDSERNTSTSSPITTRR